MSEDHGRPISDKAVIALVKQAIEVARQEALLGVENEEGIHVPVKTGLTVDLGHKSIARIPEEAVDSLRDEIERLALSHNQLTTLPPRLVECNRLRYLNVRYNSMRELPSAVLKLYSLEILDISKNRLKSLPDELANLTSLKVLAIQKNKIEKLPLCLAEIGSLQVLKLDGNPISFPPPEICTLRKDGPSPSNENERDAAVTSQVKRYLRQISTRERLRIESEGESSESNVETPKPPRRMASGRFPVKPSVSGIDGLEVRPDSPGAPPIPIRSHYRGQSQQSNNGRRPIISPLTISNERNRSQSDGASSATLRATKRSGVVLKNVNELGNVEEVRNKPSVGHLRNGSGASALSGSTLNNTSASSSFSSDTPTQRTLAHRPLSDLLEHKRRSRAPDVVVEASKTILYALHQLHEPIIRILPKLRFTKEGNGIQRGQALQRRINDSVVNVRSMDTHLQQFDTLAEEDDEDATKLSALIRDDLSRCLHLYMMLFSSLRDSVKEIGTYADPRYVRTMLLLLQGSTAEIRNACSVLGVDFMLDPQGSRQPSKQPYGSISSIISEPKDAKANTRYENSAAYHANGNLPVNGSSNALEINEASRMADMGGVTPRSGESFATLSTRAGTEIADHELEEEHDHFMKIYVKLKTATETVMGILPQYRHWFQKQRTVLEGDADMSDSRLRILAELVQKSDDIVLCTQALLDRVSNFQLKDTAARSQQDFWQQSKTFCKLWLDFSQLIIEGSRLQVLNEQIRKKMKPIHRSIKDLSVEINASPWANLTLQSSSSSLIPPLPTTATLKSVSGMNGNILQSRPGTAMSLHPTNMLPPSVPKPINTTIASQASMAQNTINMGLVTPVPATPLSAALGAAAQATMPSHHPALSNSSQVSVTSNGVSSGLPQSGGYPGTSVVFERADRLLSNTQRRI